jgi:O-antigen ligase
MAQSRPGRWCVELLSLRANDTVRVVPKHPADDHAAAVAGDAEDTRAHAARTPPDVRLIVAATVAAAAGILIAAFLDANIAVGGVIAIALFVLGMRNMYWFVLAVLALRSSLDWFTKYQANGGDSPVTGFQPAIVLGGLILVVSALWLVAQVVNGSLVRLSMAAWGFSLLAIISMTTAAAGNDPLLSGTTALRFVAGALLLLVVEQLVAVDRRRIIPLVTAMAVSFVVPGWLALRDLINRTPERNWVQGPFVNRNSLGVYLVIMVLTLIPMRRTVVGGRRLFFSLIIVLGSVFVVFTYMRSGWIAVAAGLVMIGLLQDRWVFAALAVGAFAVWTFAPSVGDRVAELEIEREVGRGDPNSFEFRQRYWTEIIARYIDGEPVDQQLGGVGLGTVEAESLDQLEPHNVWVQSLVEMGVIGVGGMLIAVSATTATLFDARRRWKKPDGGPERSAAVAGIAVAVGYLVFTISENVLTQSVTLIYLAVPLGIAGALSRTGPPRSIGGLVRLDDDRGELVGQP